MYQSIHNVEFIFYTSFWQINVSSLPSAFLFFNVSTHYLANACMGLLCTIRRTLSFFIFLKTI